MQKKIIIDTDPGQDDAVAILLALASPNELNCLGITTVAGNVPLNFTSKNARIICELADRPELKVIAGVEKSVSVGVTEDIILTLQKDKRDDLSFELSLSTQVLAPIKDSALFRKAAPPLWITAKTSISNSITKLV